MEAQRTHVMDYITLGLADSLAKYQAPHSTRCNIIITKEGRIPDEH
jgi:hypothetical protein